MSKPSFCANCTRDSIRLQQEDWDGRLVWVCRLCSTRRVPAPKVVVPSLARRVEATVRRFDGLTSHELLAILGIEYTGHGRGHGEGNRFPEASGVYTALPRLTRTGVLRAEHQRMSIRSRRRRAGKAIKGHRVYFAGEQR